MYGVDGGLIGFEGCVEFVAVGAGVVGLIVVERDFGAFD